MCGIVGLMNFEKVAITSFHMTIFMNMLWADAARGMHGTGAFAVTDDGSSYRIRAGGPPHKLIESPEFDKFDKFVTSKWTRCVVGHNRYATRGNISTEHAHPFRSAGNTITLVHNGTLDAFKHLPDGKKYDVDSEAICNAIEIQGIEKTIKSLKGAWTLVYYNSTDKTINFLRNKERPLYVARHNKDNFLAFASEEGLLRWALNRNGMYMFDVEELPEDQLYSYSIDNPKPHVKELKGAGVTKYTEGGWQGWDKREEAVGGKGKSIVEADSKVVYLPKAPSMSSSSISSSDGGGTVSNLGRAPFPKKTGGSLSVSEGFWVQAEDLHTMKKKGAVVVMPLDCRAIDTAEAKKEGGIFQVKALCDEFPDVDFFINVKGQTMTDYIMQAPLGVRGTVRSILRSMNMVAKFPHQIYLSDPEALYLEEPVIPTHAFSDNNGSGS